MRKFKKITIRVYEDEVKDLGIWDSPRVKGLVTTPASSKRAKPSASSKKVVPAASTKKKVVKEEGGFSGMRYCSNCLGGKEFKNGKCTVCKK